MKPHDDRVLDGALRRSLADGRAADGRVAGGDDCPGADVLAAYYERSLDAVETRRLDVHFSDCARCREQLATLARSEPPRKDRVAPGWWIWDWRWLAPVAAAAAIVVLWVGIRAHEAAKVREGQIVAENRPAVNAPATEPSTEAPPAPAPAPQRTTAQPSQSMQGALAPEEKALTHPTPNLTNEAQRVRKSQDEVSRQAEEMRGGASGVPARRGEAVRATPPPQAAARPMQVPLQSRGVAAPAMAAKAPPTSNAATDTSAATSAPQVAAAPQSSEAVEVQSAGNAASIAAPTAPQQQSTPPANANGATSLEIESRAPSKKGKQTNYSGHAPAAGAGISGGATGGRMASAAKEAATGPIVIATPDRAILWRILPAGGVELSNDGGSTWQPQPDTPTAIWMAGSAPSVKICWIVGRSGAAIRTTDARTWKTIAPPVKQDLVAVAAQSAKSATVTAADGTRYKTTNGGRTWNPDTDDQP